MSEATHYAYNIKIERSAKGARWTVHCYSSDKDAHGAKLSGYTTKSARNLKPKGWQSHRWKRERGMMIPQEAKEYGCIVIEGVVISRTHHNILKELAQLNGQELHCFLEDTPEFAIEDMALNDREHIAELVTGRRKKELGKE